MGKGRSRQADIDPGSLNAATCSGPAGTLSQTKGRERGGGAEGDRTPDLLIANEALSQLSYGPRAATGCARCVGIGHLGLPPCAVNKAGLGRDTR
jgi:hypothetical protein